MKTKVLILASLLLSCTAIHAQWWSGGEKIEGNGNVTTANRSVGNYDHIAVSGFFDVILSKGTEGNLTIEAESNLIEYIETTVDDGKLKIKTKKGYNLRPSKRHQVRVAVPFTDIDNVSLSGSGDIKSADVINASNFKVAISGSGDIALKVNAQSVDAALSGSGDLELSGSTNTLEAKISGSGDVDCYALKAKDVEAKINGSGGVQVYASQSLHARVTGSGDIDYKGNPKRVDKKTSGSGDITAH